MTKQPNLLSKFCWWPSTKAAPLLSDPCIIREYDIIDGSRK